MANNSSQHILSASGNLLGFCLFVITSLHISSHTEKHNIDEFTSCVAVILTFSCLFSFASIRTSRLKREKQLEEIAEYLFILSLIGILIIILLITLNFID
jgi:Na+/melibiose symporter-like transporter